MFLEIVIFIIFLAVADLLWKRYQDQRSNIPGPTPIPFFGNIFQYINETPESLLLKVSAERELYGGMYRIWVFNQKVCVVCEPEDIEIVLSSSKHIKKNELYDLLKPWLNTGLLISSGAKWFARRKIITPTFHFAILEQFITIFDQQSNVLVQKLSRHAEDGKAFNIYRYVALAALDAVSESALGIKINSQNDPDCAYVRAIDSIGEVLTTRFLNFFMRPDILFYTIGYKLKRQQDKILKILHSFTQNIISERRKHREKDLHLFETKPDDNEIGKKKRMALLDVLLQAHVDGKPLSDDDIREEVDTFTFEGHDTTTSGICFTLYSISRHPEIQKKVFEEIREVFGDNKNKPVTYRDLQELKYTELVIKEALRMYPPVSFIGRLIEEDVNINGKFLAAGTSVDMNLLILMRTAKYFPEPDKFIPERHLVENSAETLNPFAYVPFSAGPRNCIGQKYAMLEMKSMITKILRYYELIPIGEEIKPYIKIVLRSRTGFQMGLKTRVYK